MSRPSGGNSADRHGNPSGVTTLDTPPSETEHLSGPSPSLRFLLRPKWLAFHLIVVIAVTAMIALGFWQLRRLEERRTFNRDVIARTEQPAVPVAQLLTGTTPRADIEWRPVTATGRFLADEQVLLVNRSVNGQPGSVVVTPLQLDDGRLLLVQRGFASLDAAVPQAPDGRFDITGRLRNPPPRRFGGLTDPSTGELRELQRLDIDRLAPQLPAAALPMFVEMTAASPARAADDLTLLPAPDLSDGSHLSYAIQWFLFASAAATGWVLAVRRSRAARYR